VAEEGTGERTEQATPKRMKEVRSKGQLSRSEDLTAWIGVGIAALMMPMTINRGAQAGSEGLLGVDAITSNPDPLLALTLLGEGLGALAFVLGPLLGVVAAVVLLTAALQGGIHFKKFKGKFEQFNLVTGVKRVFGTQALWQGVKALLKTAVVGLVLYMVIQGLMPVLTTAGGLPVASVLEAAAGGTASLLQAAVAAGRVLAGAGPEAEPEKDPDDAEGGQGRKQEHGGGSADQVPAPFAAAGDEPEPHDCRSCRRRRRSG
jgi:flagellar biosynthetic protein FlhB